MAEERARHERLLERVREEARARTAVVPTARHEIRAALRALGQPVQLFAEGPADVRERLRGAMAAAGLDTVEGLIQRAAAHGQQAPASQETTEQFYTPAGPALVAARGAIAARAFGAAAARLKREREEPPAAQVAVVAQAYAAARGLTACGTQLADAARPIAAVRFDPSGARLAAASWSGAVRVFDAETCEEQQLLRGHTERAVSLAWHPAREGVLASGGADAVARLWGPGGGEALRTFAGHADRLGRVAFHPHDGAWLGTAGFDRTWRLWDVETGAELLLQTGHAREVYGIAFHADGALAATTDCGGVGRVWDLRSGKSLWTLQGHSRKALAVAWTGVGGELVTAGEDHTVRVWDLRAQKQVYVLPAHSGLVADLAVLPGAEVMATAGFDQTFKLWSTRDWSLLAASGAQGSRLMGVDVSSSGSGGSGSGSAGSGSAGSGSGGQLRVAVACWDKTFKVFG